MLTIAANIPTVQCDPFLHFYCLYFVKNNKKYIAPQLFKLLWDIKLSCENVCGINHQVKVIHSH